MRMVIQRVSEASVSVGGEVCGFVGTGLCLLIGAGQGDTQEDADALVKKVVNLRIFSDSAGKMNLSLLDIGGEALAISQFTLFGDARKGRRPSFVEALEPIAAQALYRNVVSGLREAGVAKVATGRFGEDMKVSLVNDGPVTILLDSRKMF